MNRTLRTLVVYGLSIILLAVLAQWWFDQVSGPEELTLSEFMEQGRGRRLRRSPDPGSLQPGARPDRARDRSRRRLGVRGQLPGGVRGPADRVDPGLGGGRQLRPRAASRSGSC